MNGTRPEDKSTDEVQDQKSKVQMNGTRPEDKSTNERYKTRRQKYK